MGTNYYVRIDNNRDNDIHIGKSSGGWKFIFQTNTNFYESNKRGVNRFLKLHKTDIYDEYGKRISVEDFWDLVKIKENGIDLKSYYNYPYCLKFYDTKGEKIPGDMIKFEKHEDIITHRDLPLVKSILIRFIQEETIVDGLVFHDAEFS